MSAGGSKAERVYGQLRADILAGRHAPGQRLRYTELCERYRTSMGSLRESLLRLAEQGLVKGEPQQGFQVAPLSAADLHDLTDARREVETLTLRYAIADGDVEWESRIVAAHHRLSRAPQLDPGDPERLSDIWVAAHAEFHNALLGGCANQRLKTIAASLRASAELYRRWSVPMGHYAGRDIGAEHAEILAAVLARDLDHALLCLSTHVERTSSILLASLAGQPVAGEPPPGRGRSPPVTTESAATGAPCWPRTGAATQVTGSGHSRDMSAVPCCRIAASWARSSREVRVRFSGRSVRSPLITSYSRSIRTCWPVA